MCPIIVSLRPEPYQKVINISKMARHPSYRISQPAPTDFPSFFLRYYCLFSLSIFWINFSFVHPSIHSSIQSFIHHLVSIRRKIHEFELDSSTINDVSKLGWSLIILFFKRSRALIQWKPVTNISTYIRHINPLTKKISFELWNQITNNEENMSNKQKDIWFELCASIRFRLNVISVYCIPYT